VKSFTGSPYWTDIYIERMLKTQPTNHPFKNLIPNTHIWDDWMDENILKIKDKDKVILNSEY
jgi:hypothetical protein